jgi:hypothetical protein
VKIKLAFPLPRTTATIDQQRDEMESITLSPMDVIFG